MNVKVLHEKPQVIKMPSVRSSRPTDTPVRSLPAKVASLSKGTPLRNSPPKVASSSKVASPKGVSSPKVAQTKCPTHKKPYNSNVCFLCGKEGHHGSQTSCHAANKVRKGYYN